ncbi:MAG: S41 family peptidase [Candidatus Delongbacteria bacterium]|jgi:carboxyl-terminal processing protease|nr:S41 family peptidase [Candidatus Delongbacteria bacterium]
MKEFFKKHRTKLISFFTALLIGISAIMFSGHTSTNFELVKNLDIFASLVKELSLYYVDDIDYGKTIKKGIDEMLESLDPYTVYIPESKIEDLTFMTTGQYGGIGAIIRKIDKYVIIVHLYKDFPADKAGLKAGDALLEVNGVSLKNKSTSAVSELLKGQPGTKVDLKIKRAVSGETEKVSLDREKVQVDPLPYYGMLNDKVGYVRLSNFTRESGAKVQEAVTELKKDKQAEALVLDLRNNPGGLLIEAVRLCNLFVPQGTMVVSTKGKVERWNKEYKANMKPYDTELPIVVLVNSHSASASEIVAGCMQDIDRAVVVGKRTFGKGLVQTTRELSYNTKLKVTTAKYYIPSGRCIQALDYAHRNEDGSVGKIPDTLISEFETQNGRTVYDGGGIMPDVETDEHKLSKISSYLLHDHMIFDFASLYCYKQEDIGDPAEFSVDDNMYQEFVVFLNEKSFDYETRSEEHLDALIEIAKKEKYYQVAENEFDELAAKIAHDRDKDLRLFKDEIKELLAEEIVGRYYYRKGKIKYGLQTDQEVEKALEILSNPEKMENILTP